MQERERGNIMCSDDYQCVDQRRGSVKEGGEVGRRGCVENEDSAWFRVGGRGEDPGSVSERVFR